MKRILFTLLLTLSSLFADVQWMDYSDALTKVKGQEKTIMVMIGRNSCSVCRYMKTVVFKDKKVASILEKKFLSVYLEIDFDDIPEGLSYMGTPTFYFLDKNAKTLIKFDGGKTVPSFMRTLKNIH